MAQQKRKRTPADPDLLRRFFDNLVLSGRLLLDRRVGTTTKLIPLLAVVYILSPIDLVPDLLLPFGVADDLGALLLGLQLFIRSAPPDVVDEYRRRLTGSPEARRQQEDTNVIEGRYEVKDD